MARDGGHEAARAKPAFAMVTVGLFALLLAVMLVRLVVGWRHGWLPTMGDIVGALFGLSLLVYLGSGGKDAVIEPRRVRGGRRLSAAAVVGRAGIAFLVLALVGNFAAAVFDVMAGICLGPRRGRVRGVFRCLCRLR